MTSRRAFLTSLLTTAAVAQAGELDLDRLLWMPGKKKIFIPASPPENVFFIPIDRPCMLIGGVAIYPTPWIRHNLILTPDQTLHLEPGMVLEVELSKQQLRAYYPDPPKSTK